MTDFSINSIPFQLSLVTVIIVNWNSGDLLAKCIDHLGRQTLLPDKILIIDNGSTDQSLHAICESPRICIRKLEKNLGFAAGNNLALSECSSKYVALLNPDAFPQTDWLETLVTTAESHPDFSSFASLQLSDDDPRILDGAGDSYHVSGLVWRERHQMPFVETDKANRPIFSACAAAALYRLSDIVKIGGFDEDFFCYVEDVDLGFRLSLAGHKALLVGNAIVRHVGSVSSGGQRSDFCVYHGHRNLVWAYVKNMPGFLLGLFLPLHLALNVISLIYFSVLGQRQIILRAKIHALMGVPRMWQKRKQIQKDRTVSTFDILSILNKRFFPTQRKPHA